MIRKLILIFGLLMGMYWTAAAQKLSSEEVKSYTEECQDLVNYLQFTLNAIGDNDLSPKEKDIIISESFLKMFRDSKVQIEDDLVPDREAVTNKDVQAYLKDVDFFFSKVVFSYKILSVKLQTNENNQEYFKIHSLRTLSGNTLQGDSIYNEQARYIEVAVNADLRELKIVSIYTTKLNEKEENIKWWNDLPISWKEILGKEQEFCEHLSFSNVMFIDHNYIVVEPPTDTITYSEVELEYCDSLGMNIPNAQTDTLFFHNDSLKVYYEAQVEIALNKIISMKELDVSGRLDILYLSPLSKLSSLQNLNLKGTLINDLYDIRNLIDLEDLNVSHTQIKQIDALVYSMSLRNLDLSHTKVYTLEPIRNLTRIKVLNISHTLVDDLEPISGFTQLSDLRLQNTMIQQLDVLQNMKTLTFLDMDNSHISDIESLSSLKNLKILSANNTLLKNLQPLSKLDNLSVLHCDNTEITSLKALDGKKSLSKIYCDNTLLGKQKALDFMRDNPQVLVVYESQKLQQWFKKLPPIWKDIFSSYVEINIEDPSKEELHQVSNIKELQLQKMKLGTLEPLSQIEKLEKLDISYSDITSIEPLYELRYLSWLNISHTIINSIAVLENNNSLQYLDINHTKITGLQALRESYSLNKLFIEQTPIKSIQPIQDLNGLMVLKADGTEISTEQFEEFILNNPGCLVTYQSLQLMEWWKELSEIYKNVFANMQTWNHQNPDSEELHLLVRKRVVTISNNRNISSLSELKPFLLLEELNVNGCQISDISSISNLERLLKLDLSQNPILDLSPLQNLTQLTTINISDTPIDHLEWVMNLKKLQFLDISGTSIKKLKPLSGLSLLETLIAYNTRVSRLKELEGLKNLKVLKIYNTKVSAKTAQQFKLSNPACTVDYF